MQKWKISWNKISFKGLIIKHRGILGVTFYQSFPLNVQRNGEKDGTESDKNTETDMKKKMSQKRRNGSIERQRKIKIWKKQTVSTERVITH